MRFGDVLIFDTTYKINIFNTHHFWVETFLKEFSPSLYSLL